MKLGKKSGLKANRRIIIGIIAVILLAGMAAAARLIINSKTKAALSQNAVVKEKAEAFELITGSGNIRPADKFEITPSVTGKIKRVYFKEGDKVKKNDLMFEIVSSAAEENIKRLRNSLEQCDLDLKNNSKQFQKLVITSPINGQISDILVKKDDSVYKSANMPLLTIADRSKLKLTVPFDGELIKNIKPGDKARVLLTEEMQYIEGSVRNIYSSSSSEGNSGRVSDVEILIDNPGAIKEGQKANVEIDSVDSSITSLDSGVLSYINSQVLKSDADGIVSSINLKEDQLVKAGTVLLTLKNDDLTAAREALNLKIKDLKEQLDYAKKQLEDYKIYAPINGTITSQDIKEGEIPRTGEPVSYISDLDHMELVVPIDDADIKKIKIGQEASVNIDALPETTDAPLILKVSKIAVEGNSVNGTTTYPVTFAIPNSTELKSGMNANIEIRVKNK